MTKVDMREYVANLEECIDRSLKLWKKLVNIENGEVVHLSWQFEQTILIIDVFWKDGDEGINLQILHPRQRYQYEWTGLTPVSLDNLVDRVGNIAQKIMYRRPDER